MVAFRCPTWSTATQRRSVSQSGMLVRRASPPAVPFSCSTHTIVSLHTVASPSVSGASFRHRFLPFNTSQKNAQKVPSVKNHCSASARTNHTLDNNSRIDRNVPIIMTNTVRRCCAVASRTRCAALCAAFACPAARQQLSVHAPSAPITVRMHRHSDPEITCAGTKPTDNFESA